MLAAEQVKANLEGQYSIFPRFYTTPQYRSFSTTHQSEKKIAIAAQDLILDRKQSHLSAFFTLQIQILTPHTGQNLICISDL